MPRYPNFSSGIAATLGQQGALAEQQKRRKFDENMGIARLALGVAKAVGEQVPQYQETFGLAPEQLRLERNRAASYRMMALADKMRAEKGLGDITMTDPLARAQAANRLEEVDPFRKGMLPGAAKRISQEVRAGPEIGPTERMIQKWGQTWGSAFPGYTPSQLPAEALGTMSPEEIMAMGALARLHSEPSVYPDIAKELLARYRYGGGEEFDPLVYSPVPVPDPIEEIIRRGRPGENIEGIAPTIRNIKNEAEIKAAQEQNRLNAINRMALKSLLQGAGEPSTMLGLYPTEEELKAHQEHFRDVLYEILGQRNIDTKATPSIQSRYRK